MHHQEFESPAELKDAIKCFWYNKRGPEEPQPDFEVVPDGYAEIIFYFGSYLKVSNNGELQPLSSPFMIGLLNQPITFHANNSLEIIGIRCYPWAVFDLLGLPPGKDGVRVFEHPVAKMQTALSDLIYAGKIQEAITLIKDYFLGIRSQITPNSMLFKAGAAMGQTNGSLPVNEVAAAANATIRTLERNFKQSSGYTVKDVSGLMRFEHVRNNLWLNPHVNLAALAHDLGYTDQPHLSREFKRYSGTTPAAFAREAKKGKRFTESNFVAFVQA